MKTFYSILYCTIRPNLAEKVSIGLFLGNENVCKFQYSHQKLNVIKDLFSDSAFATLKINLKALQKLAITCQEDTLGAYKGIASLKEQYFSYLSRYANNLITYSEPKTIDVDINEAVFNKLFEKFIFQLPVVTEQKLKPIENVKKRLAKTIASHVNFDAEIDNNIVPGLLVPAKVLFIGKNEIQVTGEAKDFNSPKPQNIQQQINAHLFLIDKIKEMSPLKHGQFFFICDEPAKTLVENHKLWTAVKNSPDLDLVPTNEVERIEQYMQTHGVEPLFIK
jgi:hypothetical protein